MIGEVSGYEILLLLWCAGWKRDDELCVIRGEGAVVQRDRPSDSEAVDKIDMSRDCGLISGFTATTFGENGYKRQEA